MTDLAAILGQVADPADPGTLTAVVLRTGGGRLPWRSTACTTSVRSWSCPRRISAPIRV